MPIDSLASEMGSVDLNLASSLRDTLSLERAVETGTYRGATARRLGSVFEEVVTIELSESLYRDAKLTLLDLPHVKAQHGHSPDVLTAVAQDDVPTLYFLDGHWSGAGTGGIDHECPVLAEIAAIGPGNPSDCVIVDDARLFTSTPPPPHDAQQWPHIMDLFDALRRERPDHLVTLIDDQVITVPQRARPVIDRYALRLQAVGNRTGFGGLGRRLSGMLVRN